MFIHLRLLTIKLGINKAGTLSTISNVYLFSPFAKRPVDLLHYLHFYPQFFRHFKHDILFPALALFHVHATQGP